MLSLCNRSHGRGPPRHTLYRDHSFEPSNLMAILKHVLVSEICLHLFPHMYTETMMCWRWAVGTALDFWPMGFVFTQCGDDGAIKRCCSVSLERLSTPGNKRIISACKSHWCRHKRRSLSCDWAPRSIPKSTRKRTSKKHEIILEFNTNTSMRNVEPQLSVSFVQPADG